MTRYLTNLAGLSFRPAEAKTIVKALKNGDQLQLLRDPDNPHDATGSAIKIMVPSTDPAEPVFIGFVEALVNQPLATDLDDGYTYTCVVAQTYDDYDVGVQKALWAHPLIEIVTAVAKNTVVGQNPQPDFDADAAERELTENAVEHNPNEEGGDYVDPERSAEV